jgi:hypothetical protein
VAQAKIEIKIGGLTFSGDADSSWLEKQLDKLLEFAKSADIGEDPEDTEDAPSKGNKQAKRGTLSAFLNSHNATSNQVRKFLAVSHQGKLGNTSDCLGQNVKRGRCEKEGKQLYVTGEGFQEIGVQAP